MDGENNGNPYEQMDDLGGTTIFGNIQPEKNGFLAQLRRLLGTPNNGTPLSQVSQTIPIRIPKNMGTVWVPLTIRGSHNWECLESPLS